MLFHIHKYDVLIVNLIMHFLVNNHSIIVNFIMYLKNIDQTLVLSDCLVRRLPVSNIIRMPPQLDFAEFEYRICGFMSLFEAIVLGTGFSTINACVV
jgi:hypothetical protein